MRFSASASGADFSISRQYSSTTGMVRKALLIPPGRKSLARDPKLLWEAFIINALRILNADLVEDASRLQPPGGGLERDLERHVRALGYFVRGSCYFFKLVACAPDQTHLKGWPVVALGDLQHQQRRRDTAAAEDGQLFHFCHHSSLFTVFYARS